MQNKKTSSPLDSEEEVPDKVPGRFIPEEYSFRRIVEKSQDIIFICDIHGNFLYMNPAGLTILGYTQDELYQMNYQNIFPDEYKEQIYEFYSSQVKNGLEKTYHEIPVLCRDNSLLWIGQKVIRVEEDNEVHFYGLARNITDRLKIQEELVESEEKYRTILETMNEGYFEVNLAGDFLYFNKSICDLFGLNTMEEFRSMNYKKVMDEENTKLVFHEFNHVYTTGQSREVKFSVRLNEERRLEALISPLRDKDNTIIGFRGIARDVTDKEKILEDLKNSLAETERSEKKYRLIAENSTDVIWVLDRETLKFTYLSPSVEKVRGVTVEEGLNEKLVKVFPPEDLIRVLNLFNEELEKDKTGLYDPDRRITFESRQYKKDGQIIWVEITAKFIRDENGETIAAQGSTRDISHRKQVEQERDKFAENLEAARLVQQEILPQKSPSSELVNIAFRYLPMEEVGGDYFTFVDFREYNNLGLFIGDVSGHGVPAALYTMTVKAITDRLFRKYNINPSHFLEKLNDEIYMAFSKHFLTGIYGLFSYGEKPDTVSFSFSKGGHPYPVYFNREKCYAEYLEISGRALGFFENEEYPARNIIMNKGDRIYFYTDGLIEVTDAERKMFGYERFLALINEVNQQNLTLEESIEYILKKIIDYNANYEQEDDMVIIGIETK